MWPRLFVSLPRGPSTVMMRVLMWTFTIERSISVFAFGLRWSGGRGLVQVITYHLLECVIPLASGCTAFWVTVGNAAVVLMGDDLGLRILMQAAAGGACQECGIMSQRKVIRESQNSRHIHLL